MRDKKIKIEYHEHDTPKETYPDISNVASANECTGLMYRTPISGEEWESFQTLSSMGIPRGGEELEDNVSGKLHHSKNAREAGKAVIDASGEYSPGKPE